ncbi:GNAT family N-acetyltransferase [Paenibacillus sp. B1-33]|uniref:GNAT family N-acetyltransferase n=1 Tax=unclassified Paenibacillus TaxID=185978 RepID=UPI003D2B3BB7
MLQIINLSERMDLLEQVSQWLWKQWASEKPYEAIKYAVEHHVYVDRVPMTFVALLCGQPVGTVSLWMNDLKCRQDLYPWMASLYVTEAARGQGVGAELQNHAIKEAKRLGFDNLFLITDFIGFYEKQGWVFEELAPLLDGGYKRIYRKDLTQ